LPNELDVLNAQLSKRNQAAVKRKQIRRAWTKEDLRNDAQLAAVECPLRERNVVALGSFELVSTIPKLATIIASIIWTISNNSFVGIAEAFGGPSAIRFFFRCITPNENTSLPMQTASSLS